MKKIVETNIVWTFLGGGMEMSALRRMKVVRITGQIHSTEPTLSLKIKVAEVMKQTDKGGYDWLAAKFVHLAMRLGIKVQPIGHAAFMEDTFEMEFLFPKKSREPATITVYRTMVGIFEDMGFDGRQWLRNRYFPEITQSTYWQKKDEMRWAWLSQGERLVRSVL